VVDHTREVGGSSPSSPTVKTPAETVVYGHACEGHRGLRAHSKTVHTVLASDLGAADAKAHSKTSRIQTV